MAKNPKSDNKLMQSILDKLVVAGWLDRAALVDSSKAQRGKVNANCTPYGLEMMHHFKTVHDTLGDFTDQERHALYDLLIHWIRISPEQFGID